MYICVYIYIYIYIYIYKLNPSAPTWNPRFEPRHTADFETRGETTACTSRVYDSGNNNNNNNNVNTSIIYIYICRSICVCIYIYIHTYLQIHIYVVHYEYMALAKFSVFSPLTVLLSRSRPSSNRKCGML